MRRSYGQSHSGCTSTKRGLRDSRRTSSKGGRMLIQTEEQFWGAVATFTSTMAIDTETTGFDVWNVDELCGVSVCTSDEKTYYFPFRHKSTRFPLLADAEGPLNLPIELMQS